MTGHEVLKLKKDFEQDLGGPYMKMNTTIQMDLLNKAELVEDYIDHCFNGIYTERNLNKFKNNFEVGSNAQTVPNFFI